MRSTPRLLPLLVVGVLLAGCGRSAGATQATGPTDAGLAEVGLAEVGLVRVAAADREPMIPIVGPRLDGGAATTADLLGKVVVINAWASWCAPCREETPLLIDAHRVADPDEVAFLGLNVNDEEVAAREFAAQAQLPYPSVIDAGGGVLGSVPGMAAQGLPTTVFLDRQGRVAARILGPVRPGQVESVVDDLRAES